MIWFRGSTEAEKHLDVPIRDRKKTPQLAILVVEEHPAKLVRGEQWTARLLAVAHPLIPVLEVKLRCNIMGDAPLIVLPHLIHL